MIRVLIALLILQVLPTHSTAHELMPAFLSLEATGERTYDGLFQVPSLGAQPMPLAPRFPDHCTLDAAPPRLANAEYFVRAFSLRCDGPLDGHVIEIAGLSRTQTDVLVRITSSVGAVQSARATPFQPTIIVSVDGSAADVALTYGILGAQHILLGLDHVLFVLALLLLIKRRSVLLWTITAFTLAHSITLAVSALGLVTVPQPLVEVLVALSIIVLAAEIIKERQGADRAKIATTAPAMAFLFGLLHGLGFGGALEAIGLPAHEVPLALITFNLGVEVGQLLVVMVALLATASLYRLLAVPLRPIRGTLATAIGILSAVWFTTRLVNLIEIA
ncbi:MAG: HupE/UreJ family protein [Pseudomonadota bacterium]